MLNIRSMCAELLNHETSLMLAGCVFRLTDAHGEAIEEISA
jgi:hypothetical protein